ncbi:MAG: HD-GYP domain-containing protein, partial [Syntrophomonadaceae bacterium]
NYLESIFEIKDIFRCLSTGEKINSQTISNLSERIYNGTKLSSGLIHCIHQLRNVDEYTYTHSINTAFYSMLIAKWLELNEGEINKVIQCGLLHDVGKIKVPVEILNKPGALTKDDFEVIKKHTIMGFCILDKVSHVDKEVKQTALLHHERIDGSGYPFNTRSNYIGLYPRIVAVADVFDAMTSDRVYKKRVSPFTAFEMFKTVGITMFDLKIVNIFIKNISSLYIGMNILLNNGTIGEIAYVPPHDVLNPIINVNNRYIDLSLETGIKIVNLL